MSNHRSSRPHRGIVATTAIAAMAVAIAVSVRLGAVPETHLITQAANVSQDSATTQCSISGPGGTWVINSAGTASLSASSSQGPTLPCTSISTGSAGQGNQIQQCEAALQAAQQEIEQESVNVVFSSFMENLIQNNSARWASALASQGYQGPTVPPNSPELSSAINEVSETNYDLANAVSQAIISLLKNNFETTLDCSAGDDPVPNWYTNAFRALAEDEMEANIVNQALNAAASKVAEWAAQGMPANA